MLEFRDHPRPARLLAPFPASSVARGLGKGLGCAWYLGQRRRRRSAPGTAGSRAPPGCRGARVAKLRVELKPEGGMGVVVFPQSGL